VKVVNVQEAKTHLSRLIEVAAGGEVVVIGKHGRPMVKLTAYAPRTEVRPLGGLEGKILIPTGFDDEDAQVSALFHGPSA
jgi:prevent-host-death family protein